MREARISMGMPITVDVADGSDVAAAIDAVFTLFTAVDERFSTYKEESEIMRINRGELAENAWSAEMREMFALAEKTRKETGGYFNMRNPSGSIDPSGIVKGWAILRAAQLLEQRGHEHFFVDAGGDIASRGENAQGKPWSVGIRNPRNAAEIVKVIYPRGRGVATSGSYVRGAHIYNPHAPKATLDDIVSITVIAPDVLEADRYATAAFAMGKEGVAFIEGVPGLEAYQIDASGMATMTSGFAALTEP